MILKYYFDNKQKLWVLVILDEDNNIIDTMTSIGEQEIIEAAEYLKTKYDILRVIKK